MRVIDEAAEIDRHGWDELWREEEAHFLSLRAKEREIAAILQEEGRLSGELDDVRRKQGIFEAAGYANVLREYQLRTDQRKALEAWEQTWHGLPTTVRDLASSFPNLALDVSLFTESPSGKKLSWAKRLC